MIGLIIILVFPFIYFYTQMNNLNQKTDAIKKAVVEGKETYIDPLTGKMCWSENGALITRTKLSNFWKNGYQDSLAGDEVIMDLNTQKIYKNYSKEKYMAHIQEQINQGKCWCGERKEYRDKDYTIDSTIKFHMIDKYLYRLRIKEVTEDIFNEKGRYTFRSKITIYCYKQVYNPVTQKYEDEKEIGYKEYKELGGNYTALDFIIKHIK